MLNMKKVLIFTLLFNLGLNLASAHPNPNPAVQFGSVYNLSHANYYGSNNFYQLLKWGDWGLGASNGFQGELIIMNHVVYLANQNGYAKKISPETKTPYAIVVKFNRDHVYENVNISSIKDLQKYLHERLPNEKIMYAVKITTNFKQINGRSFPPVPNNIPSDTWIKKMQKIHIINNIRGVAFGFITSNYLSPLLVTGPHFHFISDDQKSIPFV